MGKTANTRNPECTALSTALPATLWATLWATFPAVIAFVITFAFAFASPAAQAAPEMKRARVNAVELLDKATMYSKTPMYLGISCRTAPVGEVVGLKQVNMGDTVSLGKTAIKVGVIEAVSFTEDLVAKDGRVLVRKDDVQCAIAAHERALPYDQKRCDALWVFAARCRVIAP